VFSLRVGTTAAFGFGFGAAGFGAPHLWIYSSKPGEEPLRVELIDCSGGWVVLIELLIDC
jgi:hypothetical protein